MSSTIWEDYEKNKSDEKSFMTKLFSKNQVGLELNDTKKINY